MCVLVYNLCVVYYVYKILNITPNQWGNIETDSRNVRFEKKNKTLDFHYWKKIELCCSFQKTWTLQNSKDASFRRGKTNMWCKISTKLNCLHFLNSLIFKVWLCQSRTGGLKETESIILSLGFLVENNWIMAGWLLSVSLRDNNCNVSADVKC